MMTLHRQSVCSDDERRRRGATKLAPTRVVYVPQNSCSCECTDEKRLDEQVICFVLGHVMKILRMGADMQ